MTVTMVTIAKGYYHLVSYPAGHVLRTERPSGTFSPFSWHELNKSHVTGNAKLFVFNADRAHACTIIALAICKLAATAEFSSAAIAEFIIADDGLYIWRCEVVNSLRSSDEDNTNHTYIYLHFDW